MTNTTRLEITADDLQAVLAAAILLRRYGLVSVRDIRAVRLAVNEDAQVILNRAEGSEPYSTLANDAYRATAGGPF